LLVLVMRRRGVPLFDRGLVPGRMIAHGSDGNVAG
jgi:hypothetical protein